jgi:hypothetical protein
MKANTISRRRAGLSSAKQGLLVGDLDRQVGGDGVGKDRRIVDLRQLDAGLRRKPFVELGVILELLDDERMSACSLGPFGHLLVDLSTSAAR